MRMKKFGSRAKAAKFGKAMHLKPIRVRAAKLADGTKGALYRWKPLAKKRKGKKTKRKR
jgi:hypothetical protein